MLGNHTGAQVTEDKTYLTPHSLRTPFIYEVEIEGSLLSKADESFVKSRLLSLLLVNGCSSSMTVYVNTLCLANGFN